MSRDLGYGEHVEKEPLDSAKLASLADLVLDLEDADRVVAEEEIQLDQLKERARVLREIRIPSLMEEIGLESVTTSDGAKVEIKKIIRASIPKEQREPAYDWLDEHGFGGMVKREVKVPFPKGQEAEAAALLREVRVRFPDASDERSVHHRTLEAWARKQLAEGRTLPNDLFGIFELRMARVTRKE